MTVANSLFIATVAPVFSVDDAKAFIRKIQAKYADASHHVAAYIIGYGAATIAHCNDDGEPAGSAGRPALAVLTGSGLGDIAVVVTRYFGGTKLGVGGLVRAYSEAVRQVLAQTRLAHKIPTHITLMSMPYSWFERLRLMIHQHGGQILEQEFTADITLTIAFPVYRFESFRAALQESSRGSLEIEIIETHVAIVPSGGEK